MLLYTMGSSQQDIKQPDANRLKSVYVNKEA